MDDTPDLDTNAFLESVRELKEKRQREDNERQEQLEAQIASSRLARKLESERGMSSPSMSPSTSPHRASPSSAVPSRASTLSRPPRSRPMSVDMGSPTRASSVRPMSMMSIPEKGTPLPSRDSQRFAAPDSADALSRTMSSAQSRLDRPSSPTKGMGGFVQSAMLKRNDSVNKRWSVTAGPSSLARNDSTASFRSAANADDTPTRPSSSHSTISNLNIGPDSDNKEEKPERTTTTRHSRSRSMASFSGQEPIPEGLMSPPLSPNKRWSRSPTKASWLESALTRPESPKPLASPQSTQPSWMADLAKAKQQRGNAEASPSQENIDAAKAQDTPTFGQGLLKRSSMRNTPTHSPSASRNVTPPTKAKPISLAGKSALPGASTPSLDLTPKLSEKTELEKQEPTKEVSKNEEIEQNISKEQESLDNHHTDKSKENTLKKEEPAKPTPSKPTALSSKFTEKELVKPAAQKPSSLSSVPHLPPKPQALDPVKPAASSSPRFPTLKSPELRSGEFKSPELKQETTPKTDFRSGLKSRSGTIGPQTEQEPEFKALFGKLKKAQTEKYVAPDELKNNILRGKAGLSLSAGPQKTERRDELKESLLKKKEEMTKAAAEKPAPEPKVSPAPSSVPEALSVRKQLGRSNSTLNIPAPAKSHRDITPEALSFHKNLRGKPKAPVPEKRSSVTEKAELKRASMESKPSSVADEEPAESAPKTEDKPGPETKELPKPETREPTKPAAQELPKRLQQESSKPQVQTRPMSNKIADRFNPALAGLLARGPPSTSNTPPSGSPFSPPAISRVSSAQDEPGEGTQLTHMTKSRAKGPKRRKPKSSAPETTTKATPAPEKRVSSIAATSEKRRISSINLPSPSSPTTKTPVQPRPKSAAVRAASINLSKPQIGEAEKPKTPTPTKSMTFPPVQADKPTTPVSARSSLEVATTTGAEKPKPITSAKPALSTPASATTDKSESPAPFKLPLRTSSAASPVSKEPVSGLVSPTSASRQASGFSRALPGKALPGMATAVSRSQDKPLPSVNATEADKENQSVSSVKSAASMWGKTAQTTPQKRAPIELPTKKDEEAAMLSAGLLSNSPLRYNASPKLGLGITEDTINQPKRTPNGHDQVQSPGNGAPPKPAKSSRIVSGQLSTKDLPHLPNMLDLPAGRELANFFGDVPQSNNQLQLNTDTQTILGSRSGESDKIKTLRTSIKEIKSDGTLIPLPAQQEHILFESSMYICTHIFYTASMTRMAEVYLWCGDRISESTILETQAHAKRIAREAGVGQKSTQLYIIDQAREPANFFQALGGIVITRRGSRAENLKEPYMLCGRPHMGHIAFDEVDRSKSSLCSEYPYIIARPITLQETKIWLWKGSGCGATAIGSTRLISMDLNPGGGFTEIDEGKETAEFLAEIHDTGDTSICQSPALWKGRCGNWEHSSVRLFRIETKEKPKQTAASLFTSYFSRRPSWSAPKSPNTDRPNSDGSSKSPNTDFEASISEIAPFTQDDLEPEGCYVLDANSEILVLPGPLLSQQGLWQHAFVQACLFAHDYAILSASLEDRPAIPKARVVLGGLLKEVKVKFRRWEERRGLWGSGSLMAGRITSGELGMIDVRDVLGVCCGP
ncbi:uncharacterized protein M437DRAFT_36463 [Aureobasidium melanogenum CBS 110374]|uniref:Uncharacterized protein n=1 Tax=Aureobasidium melanogenum (strain CBS 110374) TaxID=1043003 RepID=A0A074W3G1_AURM1|nr:uncharacterized protein M437DRAFT_36463 [Aureobasidium melanogenum CBS 110374]KEQ67640.1 hypothetical protein M437DRAFT_36463 [Aureobasidium melanogenum CBS 110374]